MKINILIALSGQWSVWPVLAIYWTFVNFLKPLATINLPKSLTVLGNFCVGAKIYHFSSEIIFGQLLWTFAHFSLVTLSVIINFRLFFPYHRFFFSKNEPPPASFCIISLYANNLQNENCRLQRDSNSDFQIRRRALWPLDHHHLHCPSFLIFSVLIFCLHFHFDLKTFLKIFDHVLDILWEIISHLFTYSIYSNNHHLPGK